MSLMRKEGKSKSNSDVCYIVIIIKMLAAPVRTASNVSLDMYLGQLYPAEDYRVCVMP